jgi:hypothetical protein
MAMFAMADSLARRGDSDIDQIQWMGLQQGTYGLDGHLYSRKGPGMSLLLLPLVWLGLNVPIWGPATTALLFNSLVTAATAAGILLIVRQLGYDDRLGITLGLVFGLGTLAWPYAKTCFSDPLAGLSLVAALLFLLHFKSKGSLWAAAGAGVSLAVSVATRYANLLLAAPFAFLLLWYVRQRLPREDSQPADWRNLFGWERGLWRPAAAFATPLLLTGLLLIWYNVVRYGDPFNTGYLPQESFSGVWLQGIVGLIVSPGRGLFLYAPVLLLALPAIPAALRRYPAEAWLALAIAAIHLLLYGKWFMWHGGYAWGPRFIVPAIPFIVLLMPPTVSWLRSRVWRFAAYALFALSVAPQILGLAVHFERFQNQLLTTGLPLFAPETFFQPRYSPLWGQLQFLTVDNLDFGWIYAGEVQWFLLGGLLLATAVTGLALVQHYVKPSTAVTPLSLPAAALVLAAATAGLLASVHQQSPPELKAAVQTLNARTSIHDAVITDSPEDSIPFAEQYKGRADVIGLSAGTLEEDAEAAAALQRIIDGYAKIWWLPGWLSAAPSDIQNVLSQHAFLADSRFFPGQADSSHGRILNLYYIPQAPLQPFPIEATFADEVTLRQAEVEHSPLESGTILPVVLHWQAAAPSTHNYTVFVQLLDSAGSRVAGSDSQPAGGARPTTTWTPAETVRDRHALALPDHLPPGSYNLVAGLYIPETGERLLTAAGQDSVQIATFTVSP